MFLSYQFGFRINVTTNNAFISIIENIQTRLDDNEFADGVFVDLKRAFDTVELKIHIGELGDYGVSFLY